MGMIRIALVFAGVVACYRDASAPPTNRGGASSSADDVLGFLPVESEVVIGVDAVQLRASVIGHHFQPELVKMLGEDLARVRRDCGFDPVATIERMTFGVTLRDRHHIDGVMVVRGIDGRHVLECVAQELGKSQRVTTERGVLIVASKDSDFSTAWRVVGTNTLVAQFGQAVTRDSLETVIARGAPLRSSPTFLATFDRLERGASAWFVMNGSSKVFEQAQSLGFRPRLIDGTVTITDKIAVAARMTVDSPDQATHLAQASSQIGAVTSMVERIAIASAGPVVTLDLAMTPDQAESALGMLNRIM